MNNEAIKVSRFPNLSASFLEKVIPTIIITIPPALNNPNPADFGSSPKKFIPAELKNAVMGEIKLLSAFSST
ncbi:hypothetical protein D9M72_594530 [compost metagenome]